MIDYVLPLKTASADGAPELARYLREIAAVARVIVVDGSPADVFARHDELLADVALHVRPDARYGFGNGKVNGVLTAVDRATSERIVLADDDVRWDAAGLRRAARMLDHYDVVRPQNYFAAPMPWHAQWDAARTLLNRALAGGDYPGTLVLRRSFLEGGYDGDVLFENLELLRTVRARGGREAVAFDLYVCRLPPTTRHFRGQRVRQAYDSFAQPVRFAVELALLPVLFLARRRVVLLAAATVLVAEIGRRRSGGRAVFPASSVWFAPLWVGERAVCAWLAVLARLRGGVRYGERRIRVAAHSQRALVRAVAERFERRAAAPA